MTQRLAGLLLVVSTFLLCFLVQEASGKIVYCSPTGSDTKGDGSITNPFFSIGKASLANLTPGDAIQLRDGVYHVGDSGSVSLRGTENNYISIERYPGENPVIDSSGFNISGGRAPVMLLNSAYVKITGLEIRNSAYYGANFWNCDYITFTNNYVHNVMAQAIMGTGNGMVIENNEVAFGSMLNYMNPPVFKNGGWPGVVMAWRGPNNIRSTNWTIRNNYIHDCWGEGIIGTFDGGVIQGNIVHDTWSVNIYLDGGLGASNLWVDSNFVYSMNATYNRNGYPASGIEWSSEAYNFALFPVVNMVISNNLIYQTGQGFSYWHDSLNTNKQASTYSNISFVYNIVWEPHLSSISIATVPVGFDQPTNCLFWNNIFSNSSVSVGNIDAWDFMHNDWVQGIPKIGNGTFTFTVNPNFVNPTASAGAAGFKMYNSSKLIAQGIPTSQVHTDFWGNPRDPAHPTIGLYEPDHTTTYQTTKII